MRRAHAYVPIAAALRMSIGIYSYVGDLHVRDQRRLRRLPRRRGARARIRAGIDELLELAGARDSLVAIGQVVERAAPPLSASHFRAQLLLRYSADPALRRQR
jgi:hypothetical protein